MEAVETAPAVSVMETSAKAKDTLKSVTHSGNAARRKPSASASRQRQGRQRSRGQWNAPRLRRIILVECVILAGILALALVRVMTQAPGTSGTRTTTSGARGHRSLPA